MSSSLRTARYEQEAIQSLEIWFASSFLLAMTFIVYSILHSSLIMADINQFIPFILKWEGGFVNDPFDAGGATNRKGWLNRLAEIKFTASILLIALCFCFTACGSSAKVSQSHSETLADSKKETMQISENQTDYTIATQSDWQTSEATVQETIIVKFDTSIPKDSVTGMYPVKEIIMKNLTKGTENLSTTVSLEQGRQTQSGVEVVKEQLQIAEKESKQSQVKSNKTNLSYWLFVFALISCISLYLFLRKKQQ